MYGIYGLHGSRMRDIVYIYISDAGRRSVINSCLGERYIHIYVCIEPAATASTAARAKYVMATRVPFRFLSPFGVCWSQQLARASAGGLFTTASCHFIIMGHHTKSSIFYLPVLSLYIYLFLSLSSIFFHFFSSSTTFSSLSFSPSLSCLHLPITIRRLSFLYILYPYFYLYIFLSSLSHSIFFFSSSHTVYIIYIYFSYRKLYNTYII